MSTNRFVTLWATGTAAALAVPAIVLDAWAHAHGSVHAWELGAKLWMALAAMLLAPVVYRSAPRLSGRLWLRRVVPTAVAGMVALTLLGHFMHPAVDQQIPTPASVLSPAVTAVPIGDNP